MVYNTFNIRKNPVRGFYGFLGANHGDRRQFHHTHLHRVVIRSVVQVPWAEAGQIKRLLDAKHIGRPFAAIRISQVCVRARASFFNF
jgi:hypothetical protein